jgi:signal transduction histidine kinase
VDELRLQNIRYGDSSTVRAVRLRVVRHRLEKAKRRIRTPESMTFDIRAVLDRAPLDEQLRRLAWLLGGGFPVVLGLAGLGGVYLIRKAVRPVELAFDRERRFTGAASHELRTPLTALRGEIDVTLRRQRTTEEYIASLRRMDALVGRMTGLVEGLLLLARADAGHLLLGAGEVSLAAFREATEHTLQLLLGRERVGVVGMANDDVAFPGDLLLLTLAVRNLLENALFYAPGAAVQVEFSTDVPGEIRVRIEDCGPGLPARVLHDLTAAESDSRCLARADGSACFGLAIAQAVVQAHGGRLSLGNRSDGGCVAEIVLPAKGTSSHSTEEAIS